MYHIFFIHSSVDGHLGCFHVLALVNSAAMNIGVLVSFGIRILSRYMPRSGIAGSYGNSIKLLSNWYLQRDSRSIVTISKELVSIFLKKGTTNARNEFLEKIRFPKSKKKLMQGLKNTTNKSEDCISKMEGKVG